MPIIKCSKCGYEWEPRVKDPKVCPLCKQYIIYTKKDGNNNNEE